jgi:hypothetical protein
VRFFVLRNEVEVSEVILVEACVGKILLGEFLQRLFVEDVLEMFELWRSASRSPHYYFLIGGIYSERKLEDYQVQVCELS